MDKRMWGLLGLIVLMLMGITSHQAHQDAFWYDEILSIHMSRGKGTSAISPLDVIANVIQDRAWPPLSNLVLAGWGYVAGWSEFSGRYLSALFGVLAVAMMVQCGRTLNRSDRHEWVFGMMLLGSAFFVYYWHEMRGYTLYLFVTLVCITLYWRLITRLRTTLGAYAVFTLALIALCYTHYIATITAISLGLYHLLTLYRQPTRHNGLILACFALAGGAFVPWLNATILAVQSEIDMVRGLDLPTIASGSLYAFGNGIAVLPIVVVGASLFFIRRKVVAFLLWWLFSALVFILLFNQITEFLFHPRHILVLIVPILCLASVLINELLINTRWRVMGMGLLGAWLCLGVAQILTPAFVGVLPRQIAKLPREWVQSAQVIARDCAQPTDALIFYASLPNSEWLNEIVWQYYLRDFPQAFAQVDAMIALQNTNSLAMGFQYDAQGDWQTRLDSLIANAPTVWVSDAPALLAIVRREQLAITLATRYPQAIIVYNMPVLTITAYGDSDLSATLANCPLYQK
jgi:hypothetical protein